MSSLASVFDFSPRRVFLLTGGRLSAFHWRGGRLGLPALHFDADEAGLRGFADYLMRSPPTPSSLLVDLVEEEFRTERVPHVFGGDRRAVLRNREQRLFRDTRYAGAIVQGREREGRRDDIVLFSALIRPELLSPWLSPIAKAKVPLAGIYSVPLLTPLLLRRLPTQASHVLIVTLQASGALRQTYLEDGQLRISRLALAPRLDPTQHAAYILTEVEKLRRYLSSVRMLEPGQEMDVLILTGRSLLHDLRRQIASRADVRYQVLELNEVARLVRLKTALNTSYADGLFAHLLALEAPSDHYARPEDTRYMRHHQARSAMSAASLFILLGSIAYAGYQFIDSVLVRREAQTLAEQAAFYEERYRVAREGMAELYRKAGLPSVVAQPAELKQAVELVEALQRYRADPLALMSVVSAGLDGADSVRIERIDWASTRDPSAELATQGGLVPRGNDFRNPARAVPAVAEGEHYQLARVYGRIDPFNGDFRDALDRVNRFAAALDSLESVHEVRLTRLPFDASSQRRLAGSATIEARVEQAEFELRLVVRTGGDGSETG